jgi:hypothetical protein
MTMQYYKQEEAICLDKNARTFLLCRNETKKR